MNKIFHLLLLIFFSGILSAQTPFEFNTKQESYNPLENPILINEEVWNEEAVYTLPLDFSFRTIFEITDSVQIVPGSGFRVPLNDTCCYSLNIFHWPFGGSWLLDRGSGTDESQSFLEYEVIEGDNGKIFKMQWSNAGFVGDIIEFGINTVTNSDWIDFQIWLFENEDKIEVHFGPHLINNPCSFWDFDNTGSPTGPFSAFYIGNYMFDIYDEANNPLVDWRIHIIDDWPVDYPMELIGVPSDGIVWEFTPDFTLSTNNNSSEQENNIIWNPESNKLFISTNNFILCEVFTVNGKLVFSKRIDKYLDEIFIPINKRGVYLVNMISNEGSKSIKIVK